MSENPIREDIPWRYVCSLKKCIFIANWLFKGESEQTVFEETWHPTARTWERVSRSSPEWSSFRPCAEGLQQGGGELFRDEADGLLQAGHHRVQEALLGSGGNCYTQGENGLLRLDTC